MKRNQTILLFVTVTLATLSCSTFGGSGWKKGVKMSMFCEKSTAERIHYDPMTGSITERGPVIIPSGKKCSDFSKNENMMRNLQRKGMWTRFHPDSKVVLSQGEYKLNQKEGTWTFFSPDGQKTRVLNYVQDQKEGDDISFIPGNTEWKIRGKNRNDKKTGLWESRLSLRDECISSGNYNKDKKEGPWKECTPDDAAYKKNRIWVGYLSGEGSYHEGMRDGRWTTYHPNGQKFGEGNYRSDPVCAKSPPADGGLEACAKRSGSWKIYYDNGTLSTEGAYDPSTGFRVGPWVEYYRSGEKMAMGQRNSTRAGLWTFFDKQGVILGQFTFNKNDVSILGGIIYKDGKKYQESAEGKNCTWITSAGGSRIEKCERKPGGFGAAILKVDAAQDTISFLLSMQRGYWYVYDDSGRRVAEGEYLNGKRDGEWRELSDGNWVTKKYSMGRLQK